MKKFVTLVVLIFLGSNLFAQKNGLKSIIIDVPTVYCTMSKEKIEQFTGRMDGVKAVKVDIKKKKAYYTIMPDRINEEYLKTYISELGYDAGDLPASADAYKRLPKCCKKPEAKP